MLTLTFLGAAVHWLLNTLYEAARIVLVNRRWSAAGICRFILTTWGWRGSLDSTLKLRKPRVTPSFFSGVSLGKRRKFLWKESPRYNHV